MHAPRRSPNAINRPNAIKSRKTNLRMVKALAGLALLLQAASVAHAEEGDNCTLTERPAKQVDAAPPRACLPGRHRRCVLTRGTLCYCRNEICRGARGVRRLGRPW